MGGDGVNQEHVSSVNISEMVSTRLLSGELLSIESSRIDSISSIRSWLSKYSISRRSDSASKEGNHFKVEIEISEFIGRTPQDNSRYSLESETK
ncbi:hypothetical protein Tco_0408454 [Tanacetum coccineum]